MGVPKGEVQSRQKRHLNRVQQGKQVFNNNREGGLERTYAKAQKHKAQGNEGAGWTSLGQRLWPEIAEDDDEGGTFQLIGDLEYCGKDPTSTFLHPQ